MAVLLVIWILFEIFNRLQVMRNLNADAAKLTLKTLEFSNELANVNDIKESHNHEHRMVWRVDSAG